MHSAEFQRTVRYWSSRPRRATAALVVASMTAIVAYWLLYIMQREQRPQRTSPSPLPRHRAV